MSLSVQVFCSAAVSRILQPKKKLHANESS